MLGCRPPTQDACRAVCECEGGEVEACEESCVASYQQLKELMEPACYDAQVGVLDCVSKLSCEDAEIYLQHPYEDQGDYPCKDADQALEDAC